MGISYVEPNHKRLLRRNRTPIEHIRFGYYRKVSHVHGYIHERYEAHGQRSREFDCLDWVTDFRQGIVGIGISNIGPSLISCVIYQKSILNHPPDDIVHSDHKRVGSKVGALPERLPCVVIGLIVFLPDSESRGTNQTQETRSSNQYQNDQLEGSECILKP